MERAIEARVADGIETPIDLSEVERAVELVLDTEGVGEAEISVALVRDAEISALNERYLGHAGPTDVISFPLHRPGGAPLGDIYIGVEQAARQASESGITSREEILRLAVHGTLHVLGHDHPDGEEREEAPMYLRQEEILSRLLAQGGR